MTNAVELFSPNELARALGLSDGSGGVLSTSGLAEFCRTAVWRWGLCPKAALTKCVKSRLRACGVDEDEAQKHYDHTLGDILKIGDIASVRSRGQLRLARVQPNWIRINDLVGALVGTIPSSAVGVGLFERSHNDICRRFRLDNSELLAAFCEHSIAECQLNAWIGGPGFASSLMRLSGNARGSLDELWPHFVRRLDSEGLPLVSLESIAIVNGSPGTFFGRPGGSEHQSTGRWMTPTIPGIWVGKRRGFGEHHFHPLILRVDGNGQARSIDLFDEEEFRWALLARGISEGSRECAILIRENDHLIVRITCPLPSQVERVLHLLGERSNGWNWRISADLEDELKELLHRFGLDTAIPNEQAAT